ncbi:MAG: type 4a pilus biogenesis protein PilO [Thiohalocapsa sp.]|jgi:type IV pilus assembly protein PilO
MDLRELNELDLSTIGDWPLFAKVVIVGFFCVLIGVGWHVLVFSDQLNRLVSARAEEQSLRQTFERKQEQSSNLAAYRQQLVEMRESFGAMLRQLPNQTEIAALLVDVSQTGLAAGLEFELFQPAEEMQRDFYAEKPIRIRVTGRYHDFGRFISGLAALPRIVTIHDLGIQAAGSGGEEPGQRLTLDATVKTYRYLDDRVVEQ